VLAHDPYGDRRRADWTARLTAASSTDLVVAQGRRVSRGFTGHEHLDRTGLVHMNGRVYDPLLGRFLSPDPVVADPSSSQGWNLYAYVGNNPLSRTDPTGQSAVPCMDSSLWCRAHVAARETMRRVAVETLEHVFGIYVYETPIWEAEWVRRWDDRREGWVWEDHGRWEVETQVWPFSFVVPLVRLILVADEGPANEPATLSGIDTHIPPATNVFERNSADDWIFPGPHRYEHLSESICDVAAEGCTMENVLEALNEVGAYPNQTRPFAVGNPHIGDVDIAGPWGKDHVSTTAVLDRHGNQVGVRNDTISDHIADPGAVERIVVQQNGHYHISTRGIGLGRFGKPNVKMASKVWAEVDERVRDRFR